MNYQKIFLILNLFILQCFYTWHRTFNWTFPPPPPLSAKTPKMKIVQIPWANHCQSVCLSVVHLSIPLKIMSKYWWNLTKLGMCSDIAEICFFGLQRANFVNFWLCYLPVTQPSVYFRIKSILEKISMDFHQTWYVHWYCGDLVWDCLWVNFVNLWLELSAHDMMKVEYYRFIVSRCFFFFFFKVRFKTMATK